MERRPRSSIYRPMMGRLSMDALFSPSIIWKECVLGKIGFVRPHVGRVDEAGRTETLARAGSPDRVAR
jgi:hypothetical protein